MKKVILQNQSTEYTTIDQVKSHKYYLVYRCDKYGFIIRNSHNSGQYIAQSFSELTTENCWDRFFALSLIQIIMDLLTAGFEVYEFDTWQEMMYYAINKSTTK